jgi:homoserine kinase
MKEKIKVFAPASVANICCGFDVMGFAINEPGDILVLSKNEQDKINIINHTPYDFIPIDPKNNTAGVALLSYLDKIDSKQGFDIEIVQKIRPGSGLGSSASSAAAAVFAANELLGQVLKKEELVEPAMQGEVVASGSIHADNVAASMLGGFILARSCDPVDIVKIDYPKSLNCVIVHPFVEVKTLEARSLLPNTIPLKTAIDQWANVGGLVTGLYKEDFDLIKRSMVDQVAEPVRSVLIPGFDILKERAQSCCALGTGISGSGPSVFSLTENRECAEKVALLFKQTYDEMGIGCDIYVSGVNVDGTKNIY